MRATTANRIVLAIAATLGITTYLQNNSIPLSASSQAETSLEERLNTVSGNSLFFGVDQNPSSVAYFTGTNGILYSLISPQFPEFFFLAMPKRNEWAVPKFDTPEAQALYMDRILKMAKVINAEGKVFDYKTIQFLAEQQIPAEYVQRLALSLDAEGKALCSGEKTGTTIAHVYRLGFPAEYILASQRLSVQKEECEIVFHELCDFNQLPQEYLEEISAVEDENEIQYFE